MRSVLAIAATDQREVEAAVESSGAHGGGSSWVKVRRPACRCSARHVIYDLLARDISRSIVITITWLRTQMGKAATVPGSRNELHGEEPQLPRGLDGDFVTAARR